MIRFTPAVRPVSDKLLSRRVGDDVVLYDRADHDVHLLSGPVAAVWRHLNGDSDAPEVTDAEQDQAVAHLLERGLVVEVGADDGMSRRRLLQRGALVAGGALVVLPLIESISSPPAFAGCSAAGSTTYDLVGSFASGGTSKNTAVPNAPTFVCGGTTVNPARTGNNAIGPFTFTFTPRTSDGCTAGGTGPIVGDPPAWGLVYNGTAGAGKQFIDPVTGYNDYVGFAAGTTTPLQLTPDTAHDVGIRFDRQCSTVTSAPALLTFSLTNTSASNVTIGFDKLTSVSATNNGVATTGLGPFTLAAGKKLIGTANATLTAGSPYFQVYADWTAGTNQPISVSVFTVKV
jgi:hypothetical protein